MSYSEIVSSFQVRHVMAPLIPEGTLFVGMPMSEGKALLERNDFEYGVVRDDDRIIGLVSREELENTEAPVPSGPPVRRLELDYLVPEVTPIPELIPSLGAFPFHLVVRGKQIIGVVEVSDLNKHPVYAYLYCKLSLLEQIFADLILISSPKAEMWRGAIPKNHWDEANARWKKSKTSAHEIHPVYYLYFSDYMDIVASTPQLLFDLGFKGEGDCHNYVGEMNELRNEVMHPVRDLVGTHRTARQLAEIDERLQSLADRSAKVLANYREKWVWTA